MPDQAEQLRHLVASSLKRKLRGRASILTVTSGKGGVGKTNFAVNLGIVLSSQGYRTGLFDADLGLANGDLILGMAPRYTLTHVLARQVSLGEAISIGPKGLRFLAGGLGADLANLPPEQLGFLLEELVAFSIDLDFLLLDTGAGLGQEVLRLSQTADEVILLTTPDPPAFTDAYGVLKALVYQNPKTKVALVTNMVTNGYEGAQVAAHLQGVAARFLNYELAYLGAIPHDQAVVRAVRSQTPFSLAAPRGQATSALANIATKIIQRHQPTESPTETASKLRQLWRRCLGLVGKE